MNMGRRTLGPVGGSGALTGMQYEPLAIVIDSPGQFHISGNVTSRYVPGRTFVINPFTSRLSHVVSSDYGSTLAGNTSIFLSDTILFSGQSCIAYLQGLIDLTTNLMLGASGLSSGDYGGSVSGNMFDGNIGTSTYWQTANTPVVSGTTYAGGCASASFPMSWFKLYNLDSAHTLSSILLQYYGNDTTNQTGSSWNSAGTFNPVTTLSSQLFFLPASVGAHRNWRLLANVSAGSADWVICEFQGGA